MTAQQRVEGQPARPEVGALPPGAEHSAPMETGEVQAPQVVERRERAMAAAGWRPRQRGALVAEWKRPAERREPAEAETTGWRTPPRRRTQPPHRVQSGPRDGQRP